MGPFSTLELTYELKRCIDYKLFYQMIVLPAERQHCQSLRPKRPQSALNDEQDLDVKAYRYLLAVWSDNINAMVRSHRECLGEMQLQTKIKISRQQQQGMSQQIEKIYCKFEEKLLREPLSRNTQLRKGYSEYFNAYKCSQRDSSEASSKQEQPHFQNPSRQNNFMSYPPTRKTQNFFSNSTGKRPMSSKLTSTMTILHQAINNFNGSIAAPTYKMKTISAPANENPEGSSKVQKDRVFVLQKTLARDELPRSKRSIANKGKDLSGQRRYNPKEDWEGFTLNGNQIVISQKRSINRQSIQLQNKETAQMFQSARLCSKRMLSLKYSQRKSIDQIERMQIQNRIMMVNSVLSVNLPQSQGYRPKSRCWQNYFNQ